MHNKLVTFADFTGVSRYDLKTGKERKILDDEMMIILKDSSGCVLLENWDHTFKVLLPDDTVLDIIVDFGANAKLKEVTLDNKGRLLVLMSDDTLRLLTPQ